MSDDGADDPLLASDQHGSRATSSPSRCPFADGGRGKNRPALIVQHDDNRRRTKTVVTIISGNVRHAVEPTQVLVDPTMRGGAALAKTAMVRRCRGLARDRPAVACRGKR